MSSDQFTAIRADRFEPKPIPEPASASEIPSLVVALLSFLAAAALGFALPVTSQFAPEVIVVRCMTGFINLGVAAILVTAPFLKAWHWRSLWRVAGAIIPFLFLAAFSRTIMQYPNGKRVFAYTSMAPDLLACVVVCMAVMGVVTWLRPAFAHSPSQARTIGIASPRYGLMPLTIAIAITLAITALLAIWVYSSESRVPLEMLTPFVAAPAAALLFLAGFLAAASRFRQYPLAITGVTLFVTLNAVAMSMALNWSNPFIMQTWLIVGIPFDLFVTLVVGLVLGSMILKSA
jgi:hypothetical protein